MGKSGEEREGWERAGGARLEPRGGGAGCPWDARPRGATLGARVTCSFLEAREGSFLAAAHHPLVLSEAVRWAEVRGLPEDHPGAQRRQVLCLGSHSK